MSDPKDGPWTVLWWNDEGYGDGAVFLDQHEAQRAYKSKRQAWVNVILRSRTDAARAPAMREALEQGVHYLGFVGDLHPTIRQVIELQRTALGGDDGQA